MSGRGRWCRRRSCRRSRSLCWPRCVAKRGVFLKKSGGSTADLPFLLFVDVVQLRPGPHQNQSGRQSRRKRLDLGADLGFGALGGGNGRIPGNQVQVQVVVGLRPVATAPGDSQKLAVFFPVLKDVLVPDRGVGVEGQLTLDAGTVRGRSRADPDARIGRGNAGGPVELRGAVLVVVREAGPPLDRRFRLLVVHFLTFLHLKVEIKVQGGYIFV